VEEVCFNESVAQNNEKKKNQRKLANIFASNNISSQSVITNLTAAATTNQSQKIKEMSESDLKSLQQKLVR